jgi:hypothetical protein
MRLQSAVDPVAGVDAPGADLLFRGAREPYRCYLSMDEGRDWHSLRGVSWVV